MTPDLTAEATAQMRRAGTWRAYLRSEMDRGRQRATPPKSQQRAPIPETARGVECPHCGAAPDRPCTTRSGRHGIAGLHAARDTAYAALLARDAS